MFLNPAKKETEDYVSGKFGYKEIKCYEFNLKKI